MAIGKVSEAGANEELFEVGMDMKVEGNITIEKPSTMTTFNAKRTDTGAELQFGVGYGGVNRGVWDVSSIKWIFYTDGTSTFLNPATSNNVFVNNGSFNSRICKSFIRVRATTNQTPDSSNYLNVTFSTVDYNVGDDFELRGDGYVYCKNSNVHYVRATAVLWVERGTNSYAWCHLINSNWADYCSYMIAAAPTAQYWQSVTLTAIIPVTNGMWITPRIYFNNTSSNNRVAAGSYSQSSYIELEALC